MYNNTFYQATGSAHKISAFFVNNGNAGGTWDFYNNVVYGPFGYEGFANSDQDGTISMVGVASSWIGTFDYNYYGNNSPAMSFGWGGTPSQYAQSLSSWLTHLSGAADSHSTLGGDPFSGTPSEADYKSFAIAGPATTAGMSGVPCGALDGSGAIGSNF